MPEAALEVKAVVKEALPGALYRVEIEGGATRGAVTAHASGGAVALLRLLQGKPAGAFALITRALEEQREHGDRLERTRAYLPALVAIALEAGDREAARSAADELWSASEEYGTAALRAAAPLF